MEFYEIISYLQIEKEKKEKERWRRWEWECGNCLSVCRIPGKGGRGERGRIVYS